MEEDDDDQDSEEDEESKRALLEPMEEDDDNDIADYFYYYHQNFGIQLKPDYNPNQIKGGLSALPPDVLKAFIEQHIPFVKRIPNTVLQQVVNDIISNSNQFPTQQHIEWICTALSLKPALVESSLNVLKCCMAKHEIKERIQNKQNKKKINRLMLIQYFEKVYGKGYESVAIKHSEFLLRSFGSNGTMNWKQWNELWKHLFRKDRCRAMDQIIATTQNQQIKLVMEYHRLFRFRDEPILCDGFYIDGIFYQKDKSCAENAYKDVCRKNINGYLPIKMMEIIVGSYFLKQDNDSAPLFIEKNAVEIIKLFQSILLMEPISDIKMSWN